MAETGTEFELSPERASELQDAQLVDVRTSAEYDAGHAQGAIHVSLDELQAAAAGLDRERPVIFYCRAGERSRMAVDAFRASGWDAHGLEGGLMAWAERGLPLEPPGAEVAPFSSIPTV